MYTQYSFIGIPESNDLTLLFPSTYTTKTPHYWQIFPKYTGYVKFISNVS